MACHEPPVTHQSSIHLLDIADPEASNADLCGGKATGLHALWHWDRAGGLGEAYTPPAVVLTTALFDCVIRPRLGGRLAALEALLAQPAAAVDDRRRLAAELRARILRLNVRAALRPVYDEIIASLGSGPYAVRSSAPVEDRHDSARAGAGDTVLNVSGFEAFVAAVRQVWAGRLSDTFVLADGPGSRLTTAVVVQTMLDAAVSGVVHTLNPIDGRPGYCVEAGENQAVVEGDRPVERWFVPVDGRPPVGWPTTPQYLDAYQVRQVVRAAREIQRCARAAGRADQLDLEFVWTRDDRLAIIQMRPITAPIALLTLAGTAPKIQVVDTSRVSPETFRVHLPGVTGQPGVATGPLQILENPNDYELAQAGAVLVVRHVNNVWNATIPALAGLLTEVGNVLSHAAVTAREAGVPVMVGAPGLIATLGPLGLAGQVVTFDASTQVLYAGAQPTREIALPTGLWLDEAALAAVAEREHEIEASEWSRSAADRLARYGQVIHDVEGAWLGKPNISYGHLQLGLYLRGWQLTSSLLNAVADPADWTQLEALPEIRLGVLCAPIREGRHNFAPVMHRLELDQYARLLANRRATFEASERFFASLQAIDGSNVGEVFDRIAAALAYMHLSTSVNWHLVRRYVQPQLRYIRAEYQPILRELAYWTDPACTGAARRSLRREREIVLHDLAERVSASVGGHPERPTDRDQLGRLAPDLLAGFDHLARDFKCTSEDFRTPHEQQACLQELHRAVTALRTLTPAREQQRLHDLCAAYLYAGSSTGDLLTRLGRPDASRALLDTICVQEPALASLLEATARRRQQPVTELLAALIARAAERCTRYLPVLSAYPTLARVLSLGQQEVVARENGHQLMARWQRRVAGLLTSSIPTDVLASPGDLFDLHPVEVVALIRSGAPYVGVTAHRLQQEERAERQLLRMWTREAAVASTAAVAREHLLAAVRAYRRDLRPVLDRLGEQLEAARAAGEEALADYYAGERTRLERRARARLDRITLDKLAYPPGL